MRRKVHEEKKPSHGRGPQPLVDRLSGVQKRRRLVRELGKLDKREEQRMAEEGVGTSSWPSSGF